jgi:CRP/FNR family cyclic AMP-dependent transcriptional regulator
MLMRVPFFSSLSRKELELIASILHERNYLSDEIIFEEGDEGLGMYIILSGKVRISRKVLLQHKAIAEMGPNEYFGEMALLDGAPRAATAVAAEPTTVLGFFRPEFLELLDSHQRIGGRLSFALACEAARRLRANVVRESAISAL